MTGVKYRRYLLSICGIFVVLFLLIFSEKFSNTLYLGFDGVQFRVRLKGRTEYVRSWESEGISYFFLPSYMNSEKLCWEGDDLLIKPSAENLRGKACEIPWGQEFDCDLVTKEGDVIWTGVFCFLHSQNIPSMYIQIEEERLEEIFGDKALQYAADMTLVSENGGVSYSSELEYITGRGNSTWSQEKKPFTIKLKENASLLGMDSGKSWVLLANAYEGTKIMYKMTLDIANQMGIPYVSGMQWIDLYINGDYMGNYLLAEKVKVGSGRVEIEDLKAENDVIYEDNKIGLYQESNTKGYDVPFSPDNLTGGYLIEKDYPGYYERENCGFVTKRGYTFSIKGPSNASRHEMNYISDYIQTIDDMMSQRDESVLQYIDKDSFYKKYLVDEIALNSDTNVTSAYFYKKRDCNTLFAGPPWDYDGAYGESGEVWMDYTQTVLDVNPLRNSETIALDWNNAIYEMADNQSEIAELYKDIRPLYEKMLKSGIDTYAECIRDSIEMDMIRWDYGASQAGYYENYDNSVRYLKFFLTKRLQWMDERFGTIGDYPELSVTDEVHVVKVHIGDNVIEIEKNDGDCILMDEMPALPRQYEDYYYVRDNRKFSAFLPVYEDLDIYAKEKPE